MEVLMGHFVYIGFFMYLVDVQARLVHRSSITQLLIG
jgi:hypothetical protein